MLALQHLRGASLAIRLLHFGLVAFVLLAELHVLAVVLLYFTTLSHLY